MVVGEVAGVCVGVVGQPQQRNAWDQKQEASESTVGDMLMSMPYVRCASWTDNSCVHLRCGIHAITCVSKSTLMQMLQDNWAHGGWGWKGGCMEKNPGRGGGGGGTL